MDGDFLFGLISATPELISLIPIELCFVFAIKQSEHLWLLEIDARFTCYVHYLLVYQHTRLCKEKI